MPNEQQIFADEFDQLTQGTEIDFGKEFDSLQYEDEFKAQDPMGFEQPSVLDAYLENQQDKDEQGRISSFASGVAKSFISTLAGLPKSVAILSKEIDLFNEYKDKKVSELGTYKAGQWLEEKAAEYFPENPEYQEEFITSTLSHGAGSMIAFVTGGVAGRALGLSGALVSVGMGATSIASSEYQNALEKTGDPDKAFDVWLANLPIGATEGIPVGRLFKRIDNLTGGTVKKILSKSFAGGLEELIQETFQQFATNATAKQMYDVKRELSEGVGEGGAAGFILGMAMNAIGLSLKRGLSGKEEIAEEVTEPEVSPDTKKTGGELDVTQQRDFDALSKLGYSEKQMGEMSLEEAQKIISEEIQPTATPGEITGVEPTTKPEVKEKPLETITEPQTKAQIRAEKVRKAAADARIRKEGLDEAKIEVEDKKKKTEAIKQKAETGRKQLRETIKKRFPDDLEYVATVEAVTDVLAKQYAKVQGKTVEEFYADLGTTTEPLPTDIDPKTLMQKVELPDYDVENTTEDAIALGQSFIGDEAGIAQLKAKEQEYRDKIKALKGQPIEKTFDEKARLQKIAQLYSEAHEVATGKMEPGTLYQEGKPAAETKDLIVLHNLSEENLAHAEELGGLAVPSLAISRKDIPMENFGEISLIADKRMVDPKESKLNKVFDADIYSPRYPSAINVLDEKAYSALDKLVKENAVDDSPNSRLHRSELEDKGIRELRENRSIKAAFLNESGINFKKVYKKVDNGIVDRHPELLKFKDVGRDAFELEKNKEFYNTIANIYKKDYAAEGIEVELDADNLFNLTRDAAQHVKNYKKGREIDSYATEDNINKKISQNKESFDNWVEDKFKEVVKDRKFFKGFTPSGDRKYGKYTIENIVREIKGNIKGGESFFYGIGSIRAGAATQFKSIKDIKAKKGKLVDKDAIEDLKVETEEAFDKLYEEYKNTYKYSGHSYEEFAKALMDGAKNNRVEHELKEYGFEGIENHQPIYDFLNMLKNAPTEYFEAKIQRAVGLNEFQAAVVPENVSKKTIEKLESNGIEVYKYGNKTGKTRAEAVNEAGQTQDLLFQTEAKGAIELKKDGEALIHILEGADKSTIIHELVHYAIHKGILSKQDSDILLNWTGQTKWNRKAHEMTARGVERWMRKGKAPTKELQAVFDKLKDWFREIYKVIKGSEIDIKLNKEVENVFRVMFGGEKIFTEVKAKKPKAAKPVNTVGDWVKKRMADMGKGINPAHLREHGINQKENSGIFLKYARKNGLGLDDWIATAQAEGIIPKSDDAENYFIEALIEGKPIASEITLEQEGKLAQQELEYYYEMALEEGAIPENMSFDEFGNLIDQVYFQQSDMFAQPREQSKTVRFRAGKKLTNQEKTEVLKTVGDVYQDNRLQKTELKSFRKESGDPIYGYPYSPEMFLKSDITGKMIRHYLVLPDGRKAHPSELFPGITKSDIDKEISARKYREEQASYFKEERKRYIFDNTISKKEFEKTNIEARLKNFIKPNGGRLFYNKEKELYLTLDKEHQYSELLEAVENNGFAEYGTKENNLPFKEMEFYNEQVKKGLAPEQGQITLFQEQANLFTDELKESFVKRGIDIEKLSKIVGSLKDVKIPKEVPQNIYDEAFKESKKSIRQRIKEAVKSEKIENHGIAADALVPLSTRLKLISNTLREKLRRFEANVNRTVNKDRAAIEPLLKATKKFSEKDRIIYEYATKNSDEQRIFQLAKKYNIEKEFNDVRSVFDELYKRSKEVGFDIGYRLGYYPRSVKKSQEFLNYLYDTESWGVISEAVRQQEEAKGKMSEDEKANFINLLIRGYRPKHITLSKTANMKLRQIEFITPEINEFYYDTNTAMLKYIDQVNEAIEARRFFGKGDNLENSIGKYLGDMVERGEIKPQDESEAMDLLRARFNFIHSPAAISTFKNLGYITTMGSFKSGVTQIGDLAWAHYNAGFYRTAKGVIKATLNRSDITREDIGIEQIAQEFSDVRKLSKILNSVFKMVGLNKIDAIGKETLINATIEKIRKELESGKVSRRTEQRLEEYFGDESEQAKKDILAGEKNDNTLLYAFNVLSDFQPITLSEMPKYYLTAPRGRVLYMLKTFTIKQMDVFRREAMRDINQGIKENNKKRVAGGVGRMIKLASIFVLANATADVIKALLYDREIELDDVLVDNILRLVGMSKYITWYIRNNGITEGILKMLAPPAPYLEAPIKDVDKIIKMIKKDEFDEWNINDIESIQVVPVVGKEYYWWAGGGAEKTEKRKEKKESKDKKYKSYKQEASRRDGKEKADEYFNIHGNRIKNIVSRRTNKDKRKYLKRLRKKLGDRWNEFYRNAIKYGIISDNLNMIFRMNDAQFEKYLLQQEKIK